MTEREQRALDWAIDHCPQETINALAGRILDVFRNNPQLLAGLITPIIPTAQPSAKTKRFIKPTVEDIRAYCEERGNNLDAEEIFDHYEANGWIRGKTPIRNWKACVRTWENRDGGCAPAPGAAKAADWKDPFLQYARGKAEELNQ